MATIGTFMKSGDGSYNGSIRTLSLNVKQAQLKPVSKESENAPDFRIFAAGTAMAGPVIRRRRSCSISSTRRSDTLRGHRRGAELRSVKSSLAPADAAPATCGRSAPKRRRPLTQPSPTSPHQRSGTPSALDLAASGGHSYARSSREFRWKWSVATPASFRPLPG